jgi:hypothetical protein
VFGSAHIEGHTANIALMNRTNHLGNNGIATLLGERQQFFLVVADKLGNRRYAGALQKVVNKVGRKNDLRTLET